MTCRGRYTLEIVLALTALWLSITSSVPAAAMSPGSDQESPCTLPECFLPESGRRYSYIVHYPDGDSGTLTMLPSYDEGSGTLVCHNRTFSELYQESIDSRVQYQYLPDGIYRIESLGSGIPELWLPAELMPGVSWETGSGVHRIEALDAPCPSKLLTGTPCLQVVSRYHVMQDIEVESYFAVGFGRILSRIRSASSAIDFELTGFETDTDSPEQPHEIM